jgi:hypothetical protein
MLLVLVWLRNLKGEALVKVRLFLVCLLLLLIDVAAWLFHVLLQLGPWLRDLKGEAFVKVHLFLFAGLLLALLVCYFCSCCFHCSAIACTLF